MKLSTGGSPEYLSTAVERRQLVSFEMWQYQQEVGIKWTAEIKTEIVLDRTGNQEGFFEEYKEEKVQIYWAHITLHQLELFSDSAYSVKFK